jgi:ribosomal protein L11 methyltransferase
MNKPHPWIRVSVPCGEGCRDAIINFLFELGSTGTEESRDRVTGYFHVSTWKEGGEKRLRTYLDGLRRLGYAPGAPLIRSLAQENWNRNWHNHFHPVSVSSRIIVYPPWEKPDHFEGDIQIEIMPKMAFGTGTHETTRLSLILMEKVLQPGMRILDVGTGSGILSIAAVLMGAERVVGVDIDPAAVANAGENAVRNGVQERTFFYTGSLEAVPAGLYDCIVSNINRKELLSIVPEWKNLCSPEGLIVLSGLLVSEEGMMKEALRRYGYRVLLHRTEGEWIAFAAKRMSASGQIREKS